MSCPVCLAENKNKWHMPVKTFEKIIDNLVKAEGSLDIIVLSGGEPTLHPQLFDIIDAANRPEILNVSISTNGRIFFKNHDLLLKLIDKNVFISLQFDGFSHQPSRCRGRVEPEGDPPAGRRHAARPGRMAEHWRPEETTAGFRGDG